MDMLEIILLVTALLLFVRRDSKYWMVIWPGTAIHEFWHWAVGMVTNAKPVNFSLLPKKMDNGDLMLGFVEFDNINWANAIPVAMAPLLTIPAVYFLAPYVPQTLSWTSAGLVWVLAAAVSQCMPSKQDLQVALFYPKGLAVYGLFGGFLLYKNNIIFG
jgi:hypothetical protein